MSFFLEKKGGEVGERCVSFFLKKKKERWERDKEKWDTFAGLRSAPLESRRVGSLVSDASARVLDRSLENVLGFFCELLERLGRRSGNFVLFLQCFREGGLVERWGGIQLGGCQTLVKDRLGINWK